MAFLRDDADFPTAIERAALALGEEAAFVEKDYWVTQVLRALAATQAGGFVLKGGTSLSKGYGIINRFSEDVDILLVREVGQSAKTVEERLRAVTEAVASTLGLPWAEARDPGRGKHASRGDWIRYPTTPGRALNLPITPDAVLLETRVGEGQEPSEMATLTTILGRWAEVAGASYEDLAPCRVRVLEPRRTLIEKLVAVHRAVETWDEQAPPEVSRFGRHYYDIWRLLEHHDTLLRLADREAFARILADVERISDAFYAGHSPRPDGGFASATAFNPGRDTALRAWLELTFSVSMRLLPATEPAPEFTQVLKRVAQQATLL